MNFFGYISMRKTAYYFADEEIVTSIEDPISEEYVQADIGAQEVEIESELPQIIEEPTEIIPKTTKTNMPPLRPLTIAPKPPKTIPIQLKPSSGTQLLVLQGNGQPIKLLSQTGQELNLSNVQLGKPLPVKQTVKRIASTQGGLSVIQPKQVVMKKVIAQVPKPVMTNTTMGKDFILLDKYF